MHTPWKIRLVLGVAAGLAACESTNVLRQNPATDAQAPEQDALRADMATTDDALPTVDRGLNPGDGGATDAVVPTVDGPATSDQGAIKDVIVSTDAQGDGAVVEPDLAVAEPDLAVAEPDLAVAEPDLAVAEPDVLVLPPECQPGAVRPCPDLACVGGSQTCDASGQYAACVGPPELCNSRDDDCDGATDEGFPTLGDDCVAGVGVCATEGFNVCAASRDRVQCNAVAASPSAEQCNGLDDDCNGRTDDAPNGSPLILTCYEGPPETLGVGACAEGIRLCERGAFGACIAAVGPEAESCNAADDDCDGFADEGDGGAAFTASCYDGPEGTDGVGLCQAGGRLCLEGVLGACADQVLPATEICDTADNDCNGQTDEAGGIGACVCELGQSRACYTGRPGTGGVGACTAGSQDCGDNLVYGLCVGELLPSAEACNGVDDDCDGSMDEGIVGTGEPCSAGVGACLVAGAIVCDSLAGALACGAVEGQPVGELCNDIDDNCDGVVDNGLGLGNDCNVGLGACYAEGVLACGADGSVVCAVPVVSPAAELCNGVDDDCDGVADNGLGLGEACVSGIGACETAGELACAGDGTVTCLAAVPAPTPEACNGLDDDCDGSADEGNPGGGQLCDTLQAGVCAEGSRTCVDGGYLCTAVVRASAESCDGLDNDCDGLQDEDDAGDALTELCYEGLAGTEDVGACVGGLRTCDGGLYGACVGQVVPAPEFCDLADNDCNGAVDDGLVNACICRPGDSRPCYGGPDGTLGVGTCAAGNQACAANGSSYEACIGEVRPGGEVCNGDDDDCNGQTDEVPGVGLECGAGAGACAAIGRLVCDPDRGVLVCDAMARVPVPEVCNGEDDDCNGGVDDVRGLGDQCAAGQGICARPGNQACDFDARALVCNGTPGPAGAESCNGLDDDCDGAIDDGVAGTGVACVAGSGECVRAGQTICAGAAGVVCGAQAGAPTPEICNGLDDDCNNAVDDRPVDVGVACSAGVGECSDDGLLQCVRGALTCDATPSLPRFERCNLRDDNCNGPSDEDPTCLVFTSCLNAWNRGYRTDGIYRISRDNGANVYELYCDQTTDGGGWTLVGSTATTTLNDQRSNWYEDLTTLAPAAGHAGIFPVLRAAGVNAHDVRFACRAQAGAHAAPLDVDLSFYSVVWYNEWTTGSDQDSCFSENNGQGDEFPQPARRNNRNGTLLPVGTPWISLVNNDQRYLEGEDQCNATDDFTVDLQDRGMNSNEADGTDWGEDDGAFKCGRQGNVQNGQWFVYVREPLQRQNVGSFLVGNGPDFDEAVPQSCVETCAQLLGGDVANYQCSTLVDSINRRALVDGFGDPRFCVAAGGFGGVADTFERGAVYACGVNGCAYSAYVSDHDLCDNARNYCWRRVIP